MFHVNEFVTAAGEVPARSTADRWQQVALLGLATAVDGDERARVGLGAALCALDHPIEAGRVLASVAPEDPWGRWWSVMAIGQTGDLDALGPAIHAARAAVRPKGADGRDVARMLADLDAELSELGGAGEGTARFTILGHRARPERRALVGGRSSAVFLISPSWESLEVVRLCPSEGRAGRNAAHVTWAEVLECVRRGEPGAGRDVPDDRPAVADPRPMLDALHDDPATRDGQLLKLAEEVRAERARLTAERARLAEEWSTVDAEKLRARRAKERAEATRAPREVAVPATADDAAALLGVRSGASASTVQRRWRELVASCHPDRVEGLHPLIVQRARDLAVALNAARELLGAGRPRR